MTILNGIIRKTILTCDL